MEKIIHHYGPQGQILAFHNFDDFYPVNRYQSLLLATNTYSEALNYSSSQQRPLESIRTVELCCGGGSVAVSLKSGGVGYVEASDINPRALEICENNASLNELVLDRIVLRDMLTETNDSKEKYDIIACNPPCGRTDLVPEDIDYGLALAVHGGSGGIDLIENLLSQSKRCLAENGRLVFVLTSTMSFLPVVALLEQYFPNSWCQAYHTPVAQPFVRKNSEKSKLILDLAEKRKIFAWDGHDGWIWRMTWVIVATQTQNQAEKKNHRPTGLWFLPHAYDIELPEFRALLAHFTKE